MTNFNSKQSSNLPAKDQQFGEKGQQQNTLYIQKGKSTKKPQLSATFYDVSTQKSKAAKQDPFAAFDKPDISPFNNKEGNTEFSSSKGFNLTSNDLKKQGVTLDKVLGGGFKKIDIYDSSFKGPDNPDLFPAGVLEGDPDEQLHENGGYNYESFEILESENEEELNNESNSGIGRKQSRKRGRTMAGDYPQSNPFNEITEKINKKYKHKVPVPAMKHKLGRAFRSPEPFANHEFVNLGEEQSEQSKSNRNNTNPEEYDDAGAGFMTKKRGYNQTHTAFVKETDSRSLSPFAGRDRHSYGQKQDEFQGSFYNAKERQRERSNNQYNSSRQNFHKNETGNQFRTSKGFKKTFYEEQREGSYEEYNLRPNAHAARDKINEDPYGRMRDTKQSFVSAYGIDSEREKRQKPPGVVGSESSRMRDTGTRFHNVKIGLKSYQQQNAFENNRIAERIKQHEQEMLEKYAGKRFGNQDDRKKNNLAIH